MGILREILKGIMTSSSSQDKNNQMYQPQKTYTPEEYVIYEQEQAGETWHGVPLSELSKLAQTTYRGKYVTVDKWNFLVFHYSSNSKKTRLSVQCVLDDNGRIKQMPRNYYPGQWRDSADDFVEKANQQFTFR